MTGMSRGPRPQRMATCGVVVVAVAVAVAVAGCTQSMKGSNMISPREAKAEAIATLRQAMSLSDDAWPDVPEPAVNECTSGGVPGVQFTYLSTVESPRSPRDFQRAMAAHWAEQGYDVRIHPDDAGPPIGTIFDGTVRKPNAPWLSFSAGRLRILLYVDSRCAEGDPHEFRRESRTDPS